MQTLTTFLALALLAAPAACNGTSSGAGSDDAPQASTTAESAKLPQRLGGTPQPKLPVGTVVLETPPRAPVTVAAEVASTDLQRQMGLMWRTRLGTFEGMLFLFDEEQHLSFWMRNTVLPLDLIFIKSDWTVLGVVERATPMTDDPREVPGESQYVLEVNAGFARRFGIGPGTKVQFTPPGAQGEVPVLPDAGCEVKK